MPTEDRMLKWFEHDQPYLDKNLGAMVNHFCGLASAICWLTEPGPERTVALRKLLEAKDAAVRAKLHPGG